ncbi:MAG: hypothetical protein JSV69_06750 [Chloroflexota bacterium]|nr:MAG: hypothetical protein JSV69_06750 [Chloroflexota bacterium]
MQKKRHYRLVFPLLVLLFLALACNFPREGTPTPSGPEMLKTYAAQTIQVQLTLVATGVQPTFTPGAIESTVTPSEPSPTSPVEATLTPTPTQGVCDQAGFEKDVTIPDNTVIEAGQSFTKTWRLRNDGVCTWNSSYAIVFDRGDAMNGPPSVPLTAGTIAPGEAVDVSVDLIAPEDGGTYQGYWKLRNQAGQTFGLGKDRDKDFWVKIKVGQQSGITYDFNIQAKSATWVGSGGGSSAEVPFNGADENPDGVAKLKDKFNLENGKLSGVALVTGPKKTNDGRITGTFPGYTIRDKDHFKAKLGFQENCADGKVIFQFSIKEGETVQQLGSWSDSCDGLLIFTDVDLSPYAGREVQFVLDVLADGEVINDLVVWGSARIERE